MYTKDGRWMMEAPEEIFGDVDRSVVEMREETCKNLRSSITRLRVFYELDPHIHETAMCVLENALMDQEDFLEVEKEADAKLVAA